MKSLHQIIADRIKEPASVPVYDDSESARMFREYTRQGDRNQSRRASFLILDSAQRCAERNQPYVVEHANDLMWRTLAELVVESALFEVPGDPECGCGFAITRDGLTLLAQLIDEEIAR